MHPYVYCVHIIIIDMYVRTYLVIVVVSPCSPLHFTHYTFSPHLTKPSHHTSPNLLTTPTHHTYSPYLSASFHTLSEQPSPSPSPTPSHQVRTVKADDFWLSMNYQRDSCHVTQLLYLPINPVRRFYFGEFFEKTRKFSGRPHWGKEFQTTAREMKRVYPKMDDFLALRQDFDPKGIFVNDFLGKLLNVK